MKAVPEKQMWNIQMPVPQTDTGGLVEYTETNGTTVVKELGKIAP